MVVDKPELHRSLAADLSTSTLYGLLQLRTAVFVVEQVCPYQELDGQDLLDSTRHFWLSPQANRDDVLACLRLTERERAEFRISRVCVGRPLRGRGAGRRLIEAALAEVGDAACVLDAQSHLTGLYAGFGFAPSGDEFTEDGIPHVPMRRPARR